MTHFIGDTLRRTLRWMGGVIVSSALVSLMACSSEEEGPVVQLGPSSIVGLSSAEGVEAFLGLPFAEPPLDDLRWEPPIPWVPSEQVVDATQFAPACMQSGSGLAWYHGMMQRVGVDPSLMSGPEYSEDCLYLNVWTDLDNPEPKPVLVFIHGGSNTGGWSYEPNYRGGPLAQRGAVVVTVGYRLGVFGWLSHPDMSVQNAGLHDLIAALNWIHTHIGAFGGDPTRITVSGESAGADNALHLALAPAMKGRVAGVIHQSAGWSATSSLTRDAGFKLGQALVEAHAGVEGRFEDLKAVPAEALMASQLSLFKRHYFSPVSDPETLPIPVEKLVQQGRMPPLNLLIGSNGNESLMYIPDNAVIDDYLQPAFPEAVWDEVRTALGSQSSELEQMDRLRSALQYTCPSLTLASAISEGGGDAWVYRFNRVREGFDPIGAYHGAELPYVFDTHDAWLPTNEVDRALTRQLVAHWMSFLATGSPNQQGSYAWPRWGAEQQGLLVTQTLSGAGHSEAALCARLAALRRR